MILTDGNQISPLDEVRVAFVTVPVTFPPRVINAGSLSSKVEFDSGPALTATYDIAAGDIDNDGRTDLVLTNDKASVFPTPPA